MAIRAVDPAAISLPPTRSVDITAHLSAVGAGTQSPVDAESERSTDAVAVVEITVPG